MADITSANIVLVIGTLLGDTIPAGTIIKAFAADTAVTGDTYETAETSVGVDGFIYTGWVPSVKTMTITLSASSDSNKIIEALVTLQNTTRRAYELACTYIVPATNTAYVLTSAYLTSASPFPSAGTTLQDREYTISYGSIIPAPVPDIALNAIADING